jgi:hypothetical protein
METTNDSLLEMYLHGDLPASLRKKAEALAATPEGKARLEALRTSDEAMLREMPVAEWSDKIRRRVGGNAASTELSSEAAPSRKWMFASGFAVSFALLALVAVWNLPEDLTESVQPVARTEGVPLVPDAGALPESHEVQETPKTAAPVPSDRDGNIESNSVIAMSELPDDGLRTKGELARMRVHRVEVGSTETVSMRDGDQAAAGTTLQVALLAGPRTWVAVMSVDGAGQVSRHIPETGDSSVSVKEAVSAAHSFQMDDAPGFERFVLVESPRPFALSELEGLLAKARGDRNRPVREGWSVQSLRIHKPEARK